MEILLEQESNLNTIAALSAVAVAKTDNNRTVVSRQVQTDITKGAKNGSTNLGTFNNLPPCEPLEIYFKDLSYSVQKMFSKS